MVINSINSAIKYNERSSNTKKINKEIEEIISFLKKDWLSSSNFKEIFSNYDNTDSLCLVYTLIEFCSLINQHFTEKSEESFFVFYFFQCGEIFKKIKPKNVSEIQLLYNNANLFVSFDKAFEKGTSNLPSSFVSGWSETRTNFAQLVLEICLWIETENNTELKNWISCVELQNKLSFLLTFLPLELIDKHQKDFRSFLNCKVFHLQRYSSICLLKKMHSEYEQLEDQYELDEDEEDEKKKPKLESSEISSNVDPQFKILLEMFSECSFVTKTQENSDIHQNFQSLFIWNLLIEHLNPFVPKSKRYDTIEYIKTVKDQLDIFLPNFFQFVEVYSKERDLLRNTVLPKDIDHYSSLFASSNIDNFVDPSLVNQYCCHLYYLTLRRLPVLIKNWVNNLTTRSLTIFVEKFTLLYIRLIQYFFFYFFFFFIDYFSFFIALLLLNKKSFQLPSTPRKRAQKTLSLVQAN